MLDKLLCRFCVWFLIRDGIKHKYSPAENFWIEPFITGWEK